MKKEFRGRKTRDFILCGVFGIEEILEEAVSGDLQDDERSLFFREFQIDILNHDDHGELCRAIRQAILGLYNDDITNTYMFFHYIVGWYKDINRKLDRLNFQGDCGSVLDFEEITEFEFINIKRFLANGYDKACAEEVIRHAKYTLVSCLKERIVNIEEYQYEFFKHSVSLAVDNIKYLGLIDENGNLDSCFLTQWEYYPVDKLFSEVVKSFDSEINRDKYYELKNKEYYYYKRIVGAEVDFSSISPITIKKEGKLRKVYVAGTPEEEATLIYLAKRLKHEFNISFPNRDSIMNKCFDLISCLPNLDDYTVLKFDFKEFFDSVSIRRIIDNYVDQSNLYTHEKELLVKLEKKYKYCVQGIPVSNVLIEIISRKFDELIKASFSETGLIFYERYVDDCILIFNRRKEKIDLLKSIDLCRKEVFGNKLVLSNEKTVYHTKRLGEVGFDYLGYYFERCTGNNNKVYYKFGISGKKIEKYKKQLDAIFDAYERDNNEVLLLRRLQYYNSRIVFYNYQGSKYAYKSSWDVRGIVDSYKLLRRIIIQEKNVIKKADSRIDSNTFEFLKYYVKKKRNTLTTVPAFLKGEGCYDHCLLKGFIYNRSIVFQSNIGWSSVFLSNRLIELGVMPVHMSYYEKTREYYTQLVKKL